MYGVAGKDVMGPGFRCMEMPYAMIPCMHYQILEGFSTGIIMWIGKRPTSTAMQYACTPQLIIYALMLRTAKYGHGSQSHSVLVKSSLAQLQLDNAQL